MLPTYCTVEMVRAALDATPAARLDAQILRACNAASRRVDTNLARSFFPMAATRYFSWPPDDDSQPHVLWLGRDEAISVESITSGGTVLDSSAWFLEPVNDGPPYDRIEIDLSSSSAWSAGDTSQRAIAVTGVFGYGADVDPASASNVGALTDSATALTVDAAGAVLLGVGDAILIDDEYMIVTGRAWVDTADDLQSSVTASKASDAIAVTDGTAFATGETILIGTERMLIVDIVSNTLAVDRAVDGTTLAAHSSSASIYAARTLTVVRAALGTTAAAHSDGADVWRHLPPYEITAYALAEALNQLQQERSAFARTVASGDAEREATGVGLESARRTAVDNYSRKRARAMAV